MIFVSEKTIEGTVRAHAKINLDLYVVGRRDDGYHELSTLMAPVSLYDTLRMRVEKSEKTQVHITCDCQKIPTDETNLAARAAVAYLSAIGENARVAVHIQKRIPVSAGLGGGSSDAAAVLRFLNEAFGSPLSKDEIFRLALNIGSDVPFCLYRKMARCTGRGEIFRRVRTGIPLYVLIAKTEEFLSTKHIFAELDQRFQDFSGAALYAKPCADAMDVALRMGNTLAIAECARNMFSDVVFEHCPAAKSVHDRMRETAAFTTGVSGSGPSVFGVFTEERDALFAKRWFSCDTFVCKILD